MSTSIDVKEAISEAEEMLKNNEIPESKKPCIQALIDYIRISLKSASAPKDKTIILELEKLAALNGMKTDKMTLAEKGYKLAEILKKFEIKSKSSRKSKKRRRR